MKNTIPTQTDSRGDVDRSQHQREPVDRDHLGSPSSLLERRAPAHAGPRALGTMRQRRSGFKTRGAPRRDRGPARPRPGRGGRRRRRRHQHRLPPDQARDHRRRAARAQGAHRGHHLARGRVDHQRRHAHRDVPVDVALHDRAPAEAPRGDGPGHRVPPDRPPPPGHEPRSVSRRSRGRRSSPRPTACRSRWWAPEEVARHWPSARVDDILAAAWVPDEGRANPADVAQAYAKGARDAAAPRSWRASRSPGFTTANGRVTGVVTDRGTIETETVVIAAGMWGRELGELAGVVAPPSGCGALLPAHRRRSTGPHRDLPGRRGPRPLRLLPRGGRRLLVGLFEPVARPVVARQHPGGPRLRGAPAGLGPDGGFLSDAMDRFPALDDVGIRQFFCGPESFTPDNGPLLGEVPELRGFFAACGLNSLGILLSGGVGLDRRRSGSPTASRRSTSPASTADRLLPFMTNRAVPRRAHGRAARRCSSATPSSRPSSRGPARDVRRSVIHDRLADAGRRLRAARRATRCRTGSPPPACRTSAPQTWGRDQAFDATAAGAPRGPRGGRRDGHVVHGEVPAVQGPARSTC